MFLFIVSFSAVFASVSTINSTLGKDFRNYTDSQFQSRVKQTYKLIQENQSLKHVQKMKDYYCSLSLGKMDFYDVFKLLENVYDESDPDTNLSQIEHAYQTAEALRNDFLKNETDIKDVKIKGLFSQSEWENLPPEWSNFYLKKGNIEGLCQNIKDWSWLPLVGFIHDLGKILALEDYGNLPQWSVVGDTFPVGCLFEPSNTFYSEGFYKKSTDYNLYNNESDLEYGVYNKHCGFDNVEMSFGHDEYMYQVAKEGTLIPEEGLYIIRYHSFYPWHTPKLGTQGYKKLASIKDWKLLPLLKIFQKGDLYSKKSDLLLKIDLEKNYKKLMQKYSVSEKILW